jgi:hypothetical protein
MILCQEYDDDGHRCAKTSGGPSPTTPAATFPAGVGIDVSSVHDIAPILLPPPTYDIPQRIGAGANCLSNALAEVSGRATPGSTTQEPSAEQSCPSGSTSTLPVELTPPSAASHQSAD